MWKVGLRQRSAKQCTSQRWNSELSSTGRAPPSAPRSRRISDPQADERILERNAARKLDHIASQLLHPPLAAQVYGYVCDVLCSAAADICARFRGRDTDTSVEGQYAVSKRSRFGQQREGSALLCGHEPASKRAAGGN